MSGPGAIYYFVYQKLYDEVFSVLHIDDIVHFLLTTYCGDVINKFTCPSNEILKCIEEKTKHLTVKCINFKKFPHSEFIDYVKPCVHFPFYCTDCSHNVEDENGIKWAYNFTCCNCALFNKEPVNFFLDDARDGYCITDKFIELGFQYEMTFDKCNNEPMPSYCYDDDSKKYYEFAFDSFEKGRQYAITAKRKFGHC